MKKVFYIFLVLSFAGCKNETSSSSPESNLGIYSAYINVSVDCSQVIEDFVASFETISISNTFIQDKNFGTKYFFSQFDGNYLVFNNVPIGADCVLSIDYQSSTILRDITIEESSNNTYHICLEP